ncbi:MAG: ABC transporter ATP-binding protein [Bacillota bacterium]|nr:ABC transporter ATP-binding protein [Bacillota bacterium]
MPDPILSARGIVRSFPLRGSRPITVVQGVDLDVATGSLTILRGRSGSGKTTLLNILGALDLPTAGSVSFAGKTIHDLPERERERLRRHDFGFVFQAVALIPVMNAFENIEYALRMVGIRDEAERRARVNTCLQFVGLADRGRHMPAELSGGEQQRVAIARAIAHRPRLILADEPTGELDTRMSMQVVKIFKDLTRDEGITVLMTTHNPDIMAAGDEVYEIEDGRITGHQIHPVPVAEGGGDAP